MLIAPRVIPPPKKEEKKTRQDGESDGKAVICSLVGLLVRKRKGHIFLGNPSLGNNAVYFFYIRSETQVGERPFSSLKVC